MIIRYSIILFSLFFVGNARAQQISIDIDLESAQAIVNLLKQANETVPEEELTRVSQLYGNQQLIQKVKGYSGADSTVFKSTLRQLLETGDIVGDDPYEWKRVQGGLSKIQNLINSISQDQQAFEDDISQRIQSYTPSSINLHARACLLVGGGSLGFTIGDSQTFNVALHPIGDDIEGLKVLMAHELYHNVQSEGYGQRARSLESKPSFNEKATYALLYQLYSEGVANFVGDFTKIENPGPFSQEQIDLYIKNEKRMRTSFYLLETVLYHAYHNPKTSYGQLYNIGFTTEFEEVFYGVGYEMAKQLAAHDGPIALTELVVQDPIRFIHNYIQLYKENPEKNLVTFSEDTEELISKMMHWENAI
ncbi:hypothetical protein M8998_11030 [Sphingobacterium sp. lm-10]|uniref:DUF5700 domain-containing putative Zn-dependent protease n=1 Tax=Sphingobacterium sp. lm-10 TaxID=2944904 RepID=UPI002020E65F|nr:DUF5700 domain-containing putative Zn-dependent protease [Sphingobacterium sp. lm-10]MCL7988473.1 hypothetical protein [Sphingobacterium sp. lm-10]